MFLDGTGPTATRETAQKADVGIWLSSTVSGSSAAHPSQFITSRPPPIMDHFLLPFVKEHCLTCYPPDPDFARLKHIFIQKIHPLFPIVPLGALDGDVTDPVTIVLRQIVSLAAGTDPDGSQFLHLKNRGADLLPPNEFSQALSSSVRAILETSIITDRVLHIRALAMLSLYTQPSCAEESDLPAQLGSRAIQHIQTLGLHLLHYDAPNSDDLENLFCAVWALDRMNGAIYGRPFIIHERDIGTNLDACIKKRQPCFRLFLLVCQWLDQVIELYRPGPSAETSQTLKVAYIDLPVLEALIVEADALREPSPLIGTTCVTFHTLPPVHPVLTCFLAATIETFYHAVNILSCRLPRPGTFPAATTLPPPSANARRSLSAERIACAVPRDCLSPAPFIPYAVSLALSVEYRKMRHSRLPMFRARALTAFRRNCGVLRNFGDYFWSANVVADLGERIIKEMERASTTLVARDASPLTNGNNGVSGGSNSRDAAAHATADHHDEGQQWRSKELSAPDPMAMHMAAGMDNFVDFSAVDSVSGQDLFDHIDPNFNLTAVEDVLESHLDIGLPLNWGDWGQYTT